MHGNMSRFVVTGAAGTIGNELIQQLVAMNAKEIIAIDGREDGLQSLANKYNSEPRLQTFLADIRDKEQMLNLFSETDVVFHAAALKHVYPCERMPDSSLSTNLSGVQNIVQAAIKTNVKKVIFISSDKAVNPTNVMGATKLLGEKLVTAANAFRKTEQSTIFSSVRFGNVAGSSGSVIPLFHSKIQAGEDLLLTSPEMTRFFMTISQAGKFVIDCMQMAKGGEVFVPKMPAISIQSLAEVMIELLGPVYGNSNIKITEIGPQVGEKMYEELMNVEEVRRSYENSSFIVILPALRNYYNGIEYDYDNHSLVPVEKVCRSDQFLLLNKLELKHFLLSEGVLPSETRDRLSKSNTTVKLFSNLDSQSEKEEQIPVC